MFSPKSNYSIQSMLDEATTLEKKLSIEKEKTLFNEQLLANDIDESQINFDVYLKLLPFTRLAQEKERELVGAELNAIKLAVLFGSFKDAIEYLNKYENLHKGSTRIVHDACLFNLPEENCNLKLWQGLAKKHIFNEHFNAMCLPRAKKIEDYVKNNKEAIKDQIHERVRNEKIKQIENKYDANEKIFIGMREKARNYLNNLLEKEKTQNADLVVDEKNKEARLASAYADYCFETNRLNILNKFTFDDFLKSKLGFTKHERPTEDKIQQLEKYRKNPEMQQQFELEKIKYIERKKEEFREDFIKKATKANQTKADFIESALKNEEANIKNEVKQQIRKIFPFSENTDVSFLINLAKELSYRSADEKNWEIAKYFMDNGFSEADFNKYLQLKPQDNPTAIPEVFIDGKDIGHEKFYLEKMSPFNPNAAGLGKDSGSCQSLGQLGEKAAIFGIENPNAGFYVLRKQKGPKRNPKEDKVVAQCLAWRAETGEIVFDSVESQLDYRNNVKTIIVSDFFTALADSLVKIHQVPRVLVGEGGTTPTNLGIFKFTAVTHPKDAPILYDSYSQRIVADRVMPCVKAYTDLNPVSKLRKFLSDQKPLLDPGDTKERLEFADKEIAEKWAYHCTLNKQPNLAYLINIRDREYLSKLIREKLQPLCFIERLSSHCLNDTLLNTSDYLEELQQILFEGGNFNQVDKNGDHLLNVAIQSRNLELVEWIVEHGFLEPQFAALLNQANNNGESPIDIAIRHKAAQILKYLLKINPRKFEENYFSKHIDYLRTYSELTKVLLQNKIIDPNIRDGHYPLIYTASKSRNWDTVEVLAEYGANLNITNALGKNILVIAIENCSWDIVRLLLDKGVNPNIGEGGLDYSSALTTAIACEAPIDLIEYIIERGANINYIENSYTLKGFSPIIMAGTKSIPMVELLIRKGVDPNTSAPLGTVLHGAIMSKDFNKMKYVAENILSVIEAETLGISLLYTAHVLEASPEIMNYLIEHGAKTSFSSIIDDMDIKERQIVDIDFYQLMIENGADVNAHNDVKNTLLHKLCSLHALHENPERINLIKFLLNHGANPLLRNNANKLPRELLEENDKQADEIKNILISAEKDFRAKLNADSKADSKLEAEKMRKTSGQSLQPMLDRERNKAPKEPPTDPGDTKRRYDR